MGEIFYHVKFQGITEHTLHGATPNFAICESGKKCKKENCYFSKEDAEEKLLRIYKSLFDEKKMSLMVAANIINDLVEKFPEHLV